MAFECIDDSRGIVPCLFPVCPPPDSCKITTKTSNTVHLVSQNSNDVPQHLLATWAILLRSYTGNDSVAFLCTGLKDAQLQCTILCEEEDWTQNDSCILEYGLRDDSLVHQLRPLKLQHLGTRMRAINTAVEYNCGKMPSTNASQVAEETFATVICIEACQLNGAISVTLRYHFPILNDGLISTILSNLVRIWNCIQEPYRLVKDVSVIGSDSLTLLQTWNPKTLFCQNSCMHHLVEAISRACPDKQAVCAWDGSLTYSQLDAFASQTAKSLVERGVRTGDFVPFILEKSMWAVVAALGILKAGAAFVPMEHTHPRSRLRNIITMLKAKVLLSSEMCESLCLDLVEHVFVVSASTVSTAQEVQPYYQAPISSSPIDPMLVLFTSGSTGKPKGIVLDHAAICTHSIAHGEVMGYHGSRIFQFSAHTFDVAVMDMFTTLLFGGCICIPSEDERRTNIPGVVARLQANHIFVTPSFAGLIEPSDVPSIETMVIGGEALSQDCADRWAKAINLIQVYGPAEVGICLWNRMKPGKTHARTVGYPLSNCSCWLVDPNDYDRLVPIGATGELIVASSSLARGYLDKQEKANRLFLNPPSWAKQLGLPYQRFYRTGDLLVHNLADFDGSFTFIGRKDHQIKIRGQRLEPAEVEQRILAFSDISMAVVTTVDSGILAGELVAIVQLRNEDVSQVKSERIKIMTTPSNAFRKILENLRQNVPTYAVPSRFIAINNMPMVPSMKIDRPAVNQWLQTLNNVPDEIMASFDDYINGGSILAPLENIALEIGTHVASMLPMVDDQRKTLSGQDMRIHHVGLNSIHIISLSIFLRRRFQIVVPMSSLWDTEVTVRKLASYVGNTSSLDANVGHDIDLHSIVETHQNQLRKSLDRVAIIPLSIATTKERHILLTGATGYVGRGILKSLLMKTSNILYLLVRGQTALESFQRMNKIMIGSSWWRESFASRVHVWWGDLSEEDLGLNGDQMQILRGGINGELPCVDTIIHSAAHVNYYATFSTLIGSNVNSTGALLTIAASSCSIKNVVFVTGGRLPEVSMSSFQMTCTNLQQTGGYAQTKFVAEQLMVCAADHATFKDKHLSILRPGYVIGALDDGKANQNDFIWRFVACCLEIGAYNEDEVEHWVFIAGVDHIADHVQRLTLHGNHEAEGVSLCYEQVLSGLRFRDLWELLSEDFGYVLVGRNADMWINDIRAAVLNVGENHSMYPLLTILERDGKNLGAKLAPDLGHEFDREVIRRNVVYLITNGIFPQPPVCLEPMQLPEVA